jgi:hypothetical protein
MHIGRRYSELLHHLWGRCRLRGILGRPLLVPTEHPERVHQIIPVLHYLVRLKRAPYLLVLLRVHYVQLLSIVLPEPAVPAHQLNRLPHRLRRVVNRLRRRRLEPSLVLRVALDQGIDPGFQGLVVTWLLVL